MQANRLMFLVFLLVFSTIYLGMHYYVYHRIAHGLSLAPAAQLWMKFSFLLLAFLFVAGEFLSRSYTYPWIQPMVYLGAVWLGIVSIALSVFVARDVIGIFARGEVFRHYSTLAAVGLIGLLSAASLVNTALGPVVREVRLQIRGLPRKVSGFTIVQLSDMHLHLFRSRGWLKDVVERTNALEPDLIAITGDLIDADLCKADGLRDVLKTLKAKHGVYAVTGNHEYYAGISPFMDIARDANITVLRNARTTIANAIELAGIDDRSVIPPEEALAKTLPGPEPVRDRPLILLSHQPDVFDRAVELGVDLQLSGHTHAGQIPPITPLVYAAFKYPFGLYKKGDAFIYTSPGTGTWGPPMRIFSRGEIVKLVLEPAP